MRHVENDSYVACCFVEYYEMILSFTNCLFLFRQATLYHQHDQQADSYWIRLANKSPTELKQQSDEGAA